MKRVRPDLWIVAAFGVAASALVLGFIVFSSLGEGDGARAVAGWPPPADIVERGGTIYRTHCAVCHGQEGEGEANWTVQKADGTYPAPPHDSSGHTWHHGDGQLFEIVRDGGSRFETASFRSRMPAWGEVLSHEEIRAVLTYLKTLWGPEERAFQAEVSEGDPFPVASP